MNLHNFQLSMQFDYSFNMMLLANRRKDRSAESRYLIKCLAFYRELCTFGAPYQVAAADLKLDAVLL